MAKSSKKNLPVEVAQNELYDIVTKLIDHLGDNLPNSKTLATKIATVANDITQILVGKPSEAISYISEKIQSQIEEFLEFKESDRYDSSQIFSISSNISSDLISYIRESYKFISSPDSLVFQEIKNLLEFIIYSCHDSRDLTPKIDDKLISLLMPQYNDVEALNAFYRLFIKPIVGTKKAIQSIFDIVGENGRPVEWYENGLTPYHYAIEYDRIPEDIDIDRIIELAEWLKNERSHLLTIRTPLCGYPFRWDYTRWDKDQWDNIEGIQWKDTNVYVCFTTRDDGFDYFEFNPYQMTTFLNGQNFNYLFTDYHDYDFFHWDWLKRGEFVRQFTSYDFINKSTWSRPVTTQSFLDWLRGVGICGITICGLWTPLDIQYPYDFVEKNLLMKKLPIVYDSSFTSPNNNQSVDLHLNDELIRYMYTRDYIQHWKNPASWTRLEFYKELENGIWVTKSRRVWNTDTYPALQWDTFNWDRSFYEQGLSSSIRDRLLLTEITNVRWENGFLSDTDSLSWGLVDSDISLAYVSSHVYRKNPLISFYSNDDLVRKEIHFDITDEYPLSKWVSWIGEYTPAEDRPGVISIEGFIPELINTPYKQVYDDHTAIYEDNICGVARCGTGVTGYLSPNVEPNTDVVLSDIYSIYAPVFDTSLWDEKDWDNFDLIEIEHKTDFLADNPEIHYLYLSFNKNRCEYYNLEDKSYPPFENTMYTLNYGYGSLYTLHPEFERPPSVILPEESEGYSEPDIEPESNDESEGFEPSLDSYAESTIWDNKLWGENFYDDDTEVDWYIASEDDLHNPDSPYYDPRTELGEVEIVGDIVSPHPVGFYTKRKALSFGYTYSVLDIEDTYSPFLDLNVWNLSDSKIESRMALITDTVSVDPEDVSFILPLKFQMFTWNYISSVTLDGIKDIYSFYTLNLLDLINYRANDGHQTEYTCHTLDFLHTIKFEISSVSEFNNVSSSSIPSVLRYPNTYEFSDGNFQPVEKDYPLICQNYILYNNPGQIVDIIPTEYTNHAIDYSNLLSLDSRLYSYTVGVYSIAELADWNIYKEIDIDSLEYMDLDVEESIDIDTLKKLIPPVIYENHEVRVVENSAFVNEDRYARWNLYETSGAVIFYSSIAEHRIHSEYELDVDSFQQPFLLDDPRYANLDMDSFIYDSGLEDETFNPEYSIIHGESPEILYSSSQNTYSENELEESGYLDISSLGYEFESNEYSDSDNIDISLGESDEESDTYSEFIPDIDMESLMVPWDVDYGYVDVDQSKTYMLVVDGVYTYVNNESGSIIPLSSMSVYQNIRYEAA